MFSGTMLPVALQSALLLGLIHGVNPCGHSWLVLTPFVSGERKGRNVAVMTISFLLGTALASILIGFSLGAVSSVFTGDFRFYMDIAVNSIVIVLGVLLLVKPELIHSHDHDHDHSHDHGHSHAHHDHDHDHIHHHSEEDHASGLCCCKAHIHSDTEHVCCNQGHPESHGSVEDHSHSHAEGGEDHAHHHLSGLAKKMSGFFHGRSKVLALFTIGFVNMIVPCPTLAVMYSYAINSKNAMYSGFVFAAYALTTAIAVGGVIFAIYKVSSLARSLSQSWIETAVMRTIGILTVVFGAYSLYSDLGV